MTDQPTIPESEREDIVAYLDGELDESRAGEIERILSDSESARQDVHALQESFDLLDLLPLAKASGDFTERTLSSIRVEEETATISSTRIVDWPDRARKGAVIAGWIVGLGLVALLGFVATNRWFETEADSLVRDLPVVENLDAYADAGSVEFLERLRDSGVLTSDEEANDDE